ncbi:hypothetical protein BZA77DRAFT_358720 [Pyronema omphalodes]|nr:hypothetical protein BZA77DRAFT_358720 [Pyronema omphalodes]
MCRFCPPAGRPDPVYLSTMNGASIQARWEPDTGLPPPLSERERARMMRDIERRRAKRELEREKANRDLEANTTPKKWRWIRERDNILLCLAVLLVIIILSTIGAVVYRNNSAAKEIE